jgi:hypothetical protein
LHINKKEYYICTVTLKQTNMKDLDLRNVEVKNTLEVTTDMLETLKNTQQYGKRYFNEYDYNKEEIQRRLDSLTRKGQQVIKYTDGENILIAVNNRIWDGVSMLVNN